MIHSPIPEKGPRRRALALAAATAVTVAATVVATPRSAGAIGPPDPHLSVVPPMVTVAPDGSRPYTVVVILAQGPVAGAYVEVEFSPEATALVAWTVPVPPGADIPETGPGGGFLFAGTTDANGEVSFHIAGAGCVAEKVGTVDPYIVQVRADNVVLAEPVVNSPDAVDADGVLPEELDTSICDPVTSSTSVGLADALFHTAAIKQGLVEICTDFTDDGNPAVGLGDAGILTPYVRDGTAGSCVYAGP